MNEFASAEYTVGQLNAIIKKLIKAGGEDGPNKLLRGELTISEPTPTRSWRKENGVIYFSVTSDGTTGEDWIKRLIGNNYFCSKYRAYDILRSSDFKPTSGVTTEVAVLEGRLFKNEDLQTEKIRAVADERKLVKPNAEVACLIREKFTNKEVEAMGLLFIIAMHEPIKNSDGASCLLGIYDNCLDICDDGPYSILSRNAGFAFAVS
jgi:hypothetical protein